MQRARGNLRIAFRRCGERTVLDDLRQEGCLKARFPRPVGRTEAVTLNSSGGIAGGDRLEIAIALAECAAAVISAQAAERVYRARLADRPARVRTRIELAADSALDWMPQETILFDGCALDRRLLVELVGSARFLGSEMLVFGRATMGEQIEHGLLRDLIAVRRDGETVLHDAIRVEGPVANILARPAVAAGRRAVGTLVLVAPAAEASLEPLRAALADAPAEFGASAWNGMVVARLLAHDGAALRAAMTVGLSALRGGVPLPRVWSC